MVHKTEFLYNDTAYLRKKHFCPCCHSRLKVVKASKVVNMQSPEAKLYESGLSSDLRSRKNIRYVWKELECPECKKHFTDCEMKKIEGVKQKDGFINSALAKVILTAVFIASIVAFFLINSKL